MSDDQDVLSSLRKLAAAVGFKVERAEPQSRYVILDADGKAVSDELSGTSTFDANEVRAFLEYKGD